MQKELKKNLKSECSQITEVTELQGAYFHLHMYEIIDSSQDPSYDSFGEGPEAQNERSAEEPAHALVISQPPRLVPPSESIRPSVRPSRTVRLSVSDRPPVRPFVTVCPSLSSSIRPSLCLSVNLGQ